MKILGGLIREVEPNKIWASTFGILLLEPRGESIIMDSLIYLCGQKRTKVSIVFGKNKSHGNPCCPLHYLHYFRYLERDRGLLIADSSLLCFVHFNHMLPQNSVAHLHFFNSSTNNYISQFPTNHNSFYYNLTWILGNFYPIRTDTHTLRK